MAIVTFILGNSGEGKSFSLKHIDPSICRIINVNNKPLPFANGKNFQKWATDDAVEIAKNLPRFTTPIIVIDDFQYVMANEFIKGSVQKYAKDAVFQRYNELAYNAWNIINRAINDVAHDKRVYILCHTQEVNGRTSIKTIGKMLDDKIVLEGMVTTVLQTAIRDNSYWFMTKNNGFNTVKSPEGMFDNEFIPNDLNYVDDRICEYFGIDKVPTTQQGV